LVYTDPGGTNYTVCDTNGKNCADLTNNAASTRSQTFTYDSLNRISSALTTGTHSNDPANCWGENYGYDPWGNLLFIAPTTNLAYTGCVQESGFNVTGSMGTNNHIATAGYAYDAAGNLTTNPGVGTQTFNAENQLVSAGGQTYLYDGDGKRVEKASGSPLTANKLYWYGASSSPVIETDGAGNFQYRYISFNGMRVSREEANDWVDHYGLDALGNVRYVYGNNGAADVSDFYPFGGERLVSSGTNNRYKFTAKERDSESGLDNFGARYNSSSMGRWMSPDAINLTDERVQNPANTLNKYVYGGNNPLKYVDPDGRDITVFYTNTGWQGHFWMVAYDQNTGNSAVMNFGPRDETLGGRAETVTGIAVPGDTSFSSHITSADELKQDFTSLTIQTNPEDTQKAIQAINSFNAGSPDYKLYSQNCTTVCRDVLNKILKLDSTSIRPVSLWDEIYKKWSNTALNQRPGSKSPDVQSKHGLDYGRPRYGMNTFDFMWLLLHPQKACVTTFEPDGKGGSKPVTTCS
jgi:RHS repeat-associated protein